MRIAIMKSVIYTILSFCILSLVIFYLFYQYNHLERRVEIIESEFLSLKTKTIETEREQKEHSMLKKDNNFVDDDFKEFQKAIVEYVNKNINKIAPEKPTIGSSWIVSNIAFLSPEIIKVIYEDGHEERIMFFKIEKAYNSDIKIKPFYEVGGAYL